MMSDDEKDKLFSEKYSKILKNYLESATPEQLHIYIAWRNYDDSEEELDWFINNPNIDRATILLLYWQLGAAWYVQFSDINDIDADDDYHKATYQRLLLIEKRYSENYYARHGIYHDPYMGCGGKPSDYPEKEVKRPIPEFMLAGTDGDIYIDIDDQPRHYDDGLPLDICNEIQNLLNEIYKK